MLALLAAAWLTSTPVLAQSAGAIRGNVVDADYQTPLDETRVTVVGTSLSTRTGESGSFLFERVPPGSYTLSFARAGYSGCSRPTWSSPRAAWSPCAPSSCRRSS